MWGVVVYCANCGGTVDAQATLCGACLLDPQIPESILDARLVTGHRGGLGPIEGLLEYPGERTSLLVSIALLVIVTFVVGAATFGVFLLAVGIGLVSVWIREGQTKATLIKADGGHYGDVARLAKLAAFRLDVPLPDVYIEQQLEPNAYTAGFWREHWIVLHSCLLDLCEPAELLFVIGHEMGHIKRQHTTWLVLTSARLSTAASSSGQALGLIFNNWLQRAEHAADRAGLLACRNADVAVSALIRLAFWNKPADVERLRAEWKKLPADPIVDFSQLFHDHPYVPNRVREIERFSGVLHRRGVL